MEQFPNSVLGISQEVAEDYLPYPFELTPEEAFKREFLMRGVLNFGPTGTVIRRKEFEALGRFSGTRYIGDTEMWYKIALQYPIVKMVPGLIYWRQHEDQQIVSERVDFKILKVRYIHSLDSLKTARSLFSERDYQVAMTDLKYRYSRVILNFMIKRSQAKKAFYLFKNSDLSIFDLSKALF
jgi:hypothetical protein